MKIILSCIIISLTIVTSVIAQGDINENGYNTFYYPNGQISSEGYMKDGKPTGYWQTYYPTGVIKSEGNRRNFMLDSTWNFYDIQGRIVEKITYRFGKKTGFHYNYDYKEGKNKDGFGYLSSKELYLNNKKEGTSYYYYPNGAIHFITRYESGKKEGLEKEFNRDSVIITLTEYHDDYIIDREIINRKDRLGLKQGIWKEFYADGKVMKEMNYNDDMLDGLYKEYDNAGNLSLVIRYKNGIVMKDEDKEEDNINVVNKYDDEGNLIYSGPYRDGVPVGIHRSFDAGGNVTGAVIYDDYGVKVADGIINQEGIKEGIWINYYNSGEIKSKGNYTNGLKTGRWEFYFKDGKIEQAGNYRNGRPDGIWKWYYENGNLLREEEFYNGREDGLYVEYDKIGLEIVRGEYFDGEKEGEWFYKVGDHTEKGEYVTGLRNNTWKYYYEGEKLKFEGNYIQGSPDGKHTVYYQNGNIKEERYYTMGIKEKTWKKYDVEGNLKITVTYKDNVEYRINGYKIDLENDRKLIN